MKKSTMLLSSLFFLGSGLYMGWKAHEDSLNFTPDFSGNTARIMSSNPTHAYNNATEADSCLEGEQYNPATETCFVDISCSSEEDCDAALAELYADIPDADFFIIPLQAEDCLEGESYDPTTHSCYIDCADDAECLALAEDIYQGLDIYFAEDFVGYNDHDLLASDTGITLARYALDEQLNLQELELASTDNTADDTANNAIDEASRAAYNNPQRHQEIWQFIRHILPAHYLQNDVKEFRIFSDGEDNILAFVAPLVDKPESWQISIDIADAGTEEALDGVVGIKDFVHTIIHEFAHILTLEDEQVPPDNSLASQDSDNSLASQEISPVEANCSTFYTGEGCARASSYINLFYERFWLDIYPAYDALVNAAETEEEYYDKAVEFYEDHQQHFVSEYAASNVGEDIAETFTFFVLKDKPTGASIAEQKVLFMYEFPELVELRQHIRGQLARLQP